MRQIVLDTETTGLEPEQDHRIIEIGCVELLNRRPTGRTFHHYLNPEREIDEGALEVHGISRAFLEGKPRFADVADQLLEFISGAELVIHNAAFDVAFLNFELRRLPGEARAVESLCRVLDTLALARQMHPGQRNSLDALCKRYEVDNSRRDFHGALLDARILADVYLAMTGGQVGLALGEETVRTSEISPVRALVRPSVPLRVLAATAEESQAHEAMMDVIARAAGRCLWRALEAAGPSGSSSSGAARTLSSA